MLLTRGKFITTQVLFSSRASSSKASAKLLGSGSTEKECNICWFLIDKAAKAKIVGLLEWTKQELITCVRRMELQTKSLKKQGL